MRKAQVYFAISGVLLLTFIVFTILVMKIDVKPIGPAMSSVGFASVNKRMFQVTGVDLFWYKITEVFGAIALAVVFYFAVKGMVQWIQRRSLLKVDPDIIALGGVYFLALAAYILFEFVIVNYRPIILAGGLEASYPSSHVMIVLTVLGTAIVQIHKRINMHSIRTILTLLFSGTVILTVVGRLISGVHWFTDIVAGVLLGATLIMVYKSVIHQMDL